MSKSTVTQFSLYMRPSRRLPWHRWIVIGVVGVIAMAGLSPVTASAVDDGLRSFDTEPAGVAPADALRGKT